ncbi:20141_t:CDS:2 [Rhizophagus irregularis]|nr:20141_t:CDS:2 [Rhizophagus irregularis]
MLIVWLICATIDFIYIHPKPVGILSVSISANPNPSENVLATLCQQEVAGLDFFQWTIEKLRSEPYSLLDGLATILVTLINDLNTQRNTQNSTSVYRFARKYGIFKNWEIEEDPSIRSQRGIGENVFNDYPCVPVQGSNPVSVKSMQLGSLRVYGDVYGMFALGVWAGWEVKDSLSDSVKVSEGKGRPIKYARAYLSAIPPLSNAFYGCLSYVK